MTRNTCVIRAVCYALAGLLLAPSAALAADPTGEWWVEGHVGRVRIENCNDRMWGLISWEKESGAVDYNNPDPSKRNRPTLGLPILLGMKQTAQNRWDGPVYNVQNGKIYNVNISLLSADRLRLQGCLLGIFCGGQVWERAPVGPKANAAAEAAAPRHAQAQTAYAGQSGQFRGTGGPPKAAPFESAKDVCKAVEAANGS